MLKIFNTFSGRKDLFKSITNKLVNIYVCGVTASNYCHIGHGRTFCFFNILFKYLQHIGYKCNYVRNITDIDIELIKKSLRKNISVKDITLNMILSMQKNFSNLNFKNPTLEPKLSDNINLIISEIKNLIDNNYAYISDDGNIYFRIKSCSDYNIFYFNIKRKNFKKDFVLWKKNINSYMYGWNSPWGKGIPGWHIGCSVMSNKYLNHKIDIHGGGCDLIFPHHENDFIQSKCLYGNKYLSNYWIHTGMVLNNKGDKLSKSKNNFYLLSDLLKLYHPDIINFFFMSNHYRKNLYFHFSDLEKYRICINKLYLCLDNLNLNIYLNKNDFLSFNFFDDLFYKYMNDDINIPKVHTLIFNMMHEINKLKNIGNNLLASKLAFKMRFFANIIGILYDDTNMYLRNIKNKKLDFKIIKRINKLIRVRNLARKNNKWKIADKLRDELYKLNISLKDTNKFTSEWYFN